MRAFCRRADRGAFVALLWVVFAIGGRPASAQDLRFAAARIDDVWAGTDGRIRVQTGRKIVILSPSAGAAADAVVAATIDIPPEAVVFDHDASLAYAAPGGFFLDGRRVRPAGVSTRAEADAPPVRARLFLGGGRIAAPDSRGTAVILDDRPADAVAEFPRIVSRRSGYGLGAIAEETAIWPYVFALGAGPDAPILSGHGARFVVRSSAGAVAELPAVDLVLGSEVQGFAVELPPFTADLDGDGAPEFVRVDPGRGVYAVQTGLADAAPPSPQVRLLGGPCLAAAALPPREAAPALYVLKLPALTPARQLGVLMEKRITAQALFYRGARPGIAATPAATIDVVLSIAVAVRDGERNGRVLTLVGPTADGRLLVSEPGKPAKLFSMDGGAKPAEIGTPPVGEWRRPLRPLIAEGRLLAVLRTADGDRLYAF